MPRRSLTPVEKRAISKRMKARWAKVNHPATPATLPTNGLIVESRIVLMIHDKEIVLNIGEARQLREALAAALPVGEPTS